MAANRDVPAALFDRYIDALADLDGRSPAGCAPEQRLAAIVLPLVSNAWERHWEPADLVHVARRNGSPRIARLTIALVADEGRRSGRLQLAPDAWLDQLRGVGIESQESSWSAATDVIVEWRRVERVHVSDSIADAVRLVALLRSLWPLKPIGFPPSAWGPRPDAGADPQTPRSASEAASRRGASGGVEPRLLNTIRALLAKAEATEFPAEAETFTAKAQDLMARHSIDVAVLAANENGIGSMVAGVRSRRVHIDQPYGSQKAQLLGAVGAANHVRVVWDDAWGFATVVGFPLDLDMVEMLFTSLLIQATRSVAEAGTGADRVHTRSASFRRAFLLSFGSRIGERLEEAAQHASSEAETTYGTSLVPIMQRRTEAVAQAVDELFPRTSSIRSRSVDAMGWHAGREAADRAALDHARGAIRR